MARVTKFDTNGVKGPLSKGELAIDNHVAGGDAGRLYYNDGTEDIAVAKRGEVAVALYHSQLQSGDISLTNLIEKPTQVATTYTGNSGNQAIVTGMSTIDFTQASNGTGYYLDRATNEVKNDAGVVQSSGHIDFASINGIDGVSKVHIKNRDDNSSNQIQDGLRGATYRIKTDGTNEEAAFAGTLTAFTTNGFTVGSDADYNQNTNNYIAYQTLYTNIRWSYSNHGKLVVEAYNPQSLDTMIYYEGSGIDGHEINHSLGRELGFAVAKDLTSVRDWSVSYNRLSGGYLNTTDEFTTSRNHITDGNVLDSNTLVNANGNYYILYGFANAYYNNDGKLIGNKECGTFIRDASEIQKIPTKLKRVAEFISKPISIAGDWSKRDNKRANSGDTTNYDVTISLNSSNAEALNNSPVRLGTNNYLQIDNDGNARDLGTGFDGEEFLYIISEDTKLNGGGAIQLIPTDTTNIQVDGIVNVVGGNDTSGLKSKSVAINTTVDTSGITESGTYYIVQKGI